MPDITGVLEQPLQRATDYLPGWRERAATAEKNRSLSNETLDELFTSGLLELLCPRRAQAHVPGWPTLVQSSRTAARACASTGWMISLVGGHAAIAARLGQSFLNKLYASGEPQLFASASVGPDSLLSLEPAGVRVSGRWRFSSGIEHATWLILNAPCPGHPTASATDRFLVIVAKKDVVILDSWHAAGMRATGSHDIVIPDLLVPHDEVFALPTVFAAQPPDLGRDYLYSVPIVPFITTSIIGPVLGCAEGAYECHVEAMARQPGPPSHLALERLAHSGAQLAAANALFNALLHTLHESGLARRALTETQVLTLKRDRSYLAHLCLEAVRRLVEHSGASSMTADNPLHRHWRDLQTMVAQRDLHWDSAMLASGASTLDHFLNTQPSAGDSHVRAQ
jgi:alkylation response protein AidB-like acyl-CoA dehydrogenase